MNIKRVGMGGLVVTLLCLGGARAQPLPAPSEGTSNPLFTAPSVGGPPTAMPAPGAAPGADMGAPAGPAPYGVSGGSTWLDYQRCLGCCGPVGGNGPIAYEVYLRNGFDFPLGGNPFGARLDVGWDITAGGRTLFFDPAMEKAWAVDLSITNIFNNSHDRTTTYPLFGISQGTGVTPPPELDVAVKNLNRTYVNVSGGREWYIWGPAAWLKPDSNLRFGVDLGGRYGTEKLEVTNFHHFTDTIAGVFMAFHSDVEIPWGCCIFQAGMRFEYGYTWGDILQHQNNGDVQDMTLMFTRGSRF